MKLFKRAVLILILFSTINTAQEKIIIGTKPAPPFVIKNNDGSWGGISFDLWNRISEDLQFDYSVNQYDLENIIDAVEKREIEAAISPLTISSDREEKIDFSQPYFVTGLSTAVRIKEEFNLFTFIKGLFSVQFYEVVLLLCIILFFVGFLVWLFERKKNKEQFGGKVSTGLASGFWWAAVTMTTVGYGDKAPTTLGGRIVGFIWMFAAIIIISSITAGITSALTVNRLDTGIKNINDLYDHRVATVEASNSINFLEQKDIRYKTYKTADQAVKALYNNDVDAVVYDEPILKWLIHSNNFGDKLKVLPQKLEIVYYGFGLPQESKLRDKINVKLLEIINTQEWQNLLENYLGEE